MAPEIAVINTDGDYHYSKKVCGLYPLERNILVLWSAGIKRIYLNLSEEEKKFYNQKVKKRLKRVTDTEIIEEWDNNNSVEYLQIPSNIFLQVHYFLHYNQYFKKKKNIVHPVFKKDQFLLLNNADFERAEDLTKKHIIDNTGGYIAKNINKSTTNASCNPA